MGGKWRWIALAFLFFISSNAFNLPLVNRLLPSRYQKSHIISKLWSNKDDKELGSLFHFASSISVPSNTTATLLNLIKFGDEWSAKQEERYGNENLLHNQWERVPGCMADVRIKTEVTKYNIDDKLDNVCTFKAVADSRVARGMIALLCEGLENRKISSILSLSSTELAKECGLDKLLPEGRLNGLHNMVQLIQKQALQLSKQGNQESQSMYTPLNAPGDKEMENQQNIPPWISSSSKDEVAVLLSGGVDSSVALKLLQLEGYKVRAFYLKIWLEDEVAHLNQCPWEEDLSFAQAVCEQLNVPLETLSLQKEYWQEVVQCTFDEAKNGRTPNPDIMCNSRIKFGMFYKYVGRYFAKIATGHYAQVSIDKTTGIATLRTSPDAVKDQTYFLSNLRQEQLAKAMFPIGHLEKAQVRELANKYNLATRSRKDSQGICFLGKLKFDEFISHYLGESSGPIVCYKTNRVIGNHRGLWFHTIGQRKGLGLLFYPGNVHLGPWTVVAKDVKSNTLFVTNELDIVERPRLEFKVHQINWISGQLPAEFLTLTSETQGLSSKIMLDIKLRHGPNRSQGTVQIVHRGGGERRY